MTDGTFLYVISFRRQTKAEKEKQEKDQEEPPAVKCKLVLEVWDPSNNFSFVRSVTLMKSEHADDAFEKDDNSVDFLKNTFWATNGHHLYCEKWKEDNECKIRLFDLKSGLLVGKNNFDFQHSLTYNPASNSFFILNNTDSGWDFNNVSFKGFKKPVEKQTMIQSLQDQESIMLSSLTTEEGEDLSKLSAVE